MVLKCCVPAFCPKPLPADTTNGSSSSSSGHRAGIWAVYRTKRRQRRGERGAVHASLCHVSRTHSPCLPGTTTMPVCSSSSLQYSQSAGLPLAAATSCAAGGSVILRAATPAHHYTSSSPVSHATQLRVQAHGISWTTRMHGRRLQCTTTSRSSSSLCSPREGVEGALCVVTGHTRQLVQLRHQLGRATSQGPQHTITLLRTHTQQQHRGSTSTGAASSIQTRQQQDHQESMLPAEDNTRRAASHVA